MGGLTRLLVLVLAVHVFKVNAGPVPRERLVDRTRDSRVFFLHGDDDGAKLAPEDADEDPTGDVELDLDPLSKARLLDRRGTVEVPILDATDGRPLREDLGQWDWSSNIAPSGFHFGRGLGYATIRPVRHGDVLFSVPFAQVMTMETARQGRVRALLDANPDLPVAIAMALHLLEERFRGPTSRFHEYIAGLPDASDINSTIYYTDDELAVLEGSQLLRLTVNRRQAIDNFYEALRTPVTSLAMDPPLFAEDEFTRDNFRWAMATVWSRAYPLSAIESDVILAPILDTIGMCRLRPEDKCKTAVTWESETQRLVVTATQDIAQGEEVRVDFGSKPSSLFMLNHGLARPAPWTDLEAYEIGISLDPEDKLLDIKNHLLTANNMSMNATYVLRLKGDDFDPTMTKSLKIKLLNGQELENHKALDVEPTADGEGPRVSLRNEFVFNRAVLMTCRNLLQQYPTTLDADRTKLARYETHGEESRRLHMLRALVIEKEILQHNLDLVVKRWTDLLSTQDPKILGS